MCHTPRIPRGTLRSNLFFTDFFDSCDGRCRKGRNASSLPKKLLYFLGALRHSESLWRRASARKISLKTLLWWPDYSINSDDRTKWSFNTPAVAAPVFFRNSKSCDKPFNHFRDGKTHHYESSTWHSKTIHLRKTPPSLDYAPALRSITLHFF